MSGKHSDNEVIVTLTKQNETLINELSFSEKCAKLLQKYRNCLILFNHNCKCKHNYDNKILFNELEIEYNKTFTDKCQLNPKRTQQINDCLEIVKIDDQIDNCLHIDVTDDTNQNNNNSNSDINEEINDVIVIAEIESETNEMTINNEIMDGFKGSVSSDVIVNEQPINNSNNEFVYASDSIVFPSVPYVNPQSFSTHTRHRKAISRTRCYICPRKYDKKASVRCRICCLLICKTCQHIYCSNCSLNSYAPKKMTAMSVMSGRCYICPRVLDRKASKRCKMCKQLICRTCKHVYCVNCDSDRTLHQNFQSQDIKLPLSLNNNSSVSKTS